MTQSEARSGRAGPRAAVADSGRGGAGALARADGVGGGLGLGGAEGSSSPRRRRSTTLNPGSGSRSGTVYLLRQDVQGAPGAADLTVAYASGNGNAGPRTPGMPARLAAMRCGPSGGGRGAPGIMGATDGESGRRSALRGVALRHDPASGRGRMPLGSRADAGEASPFPPRGDVRSPRSPRR